MHHDHQTKKRVRQQINFYRNLLSQEFFHLQKVQNSYSWPIVSFSLHCLLLWFLLYLPVFFSCSYAMDCYDTPDEDQSTENLAPRSPKRAKNSLIGNGINFLNFQQQIWILNGIKHCKNLFQATFTVTYCTVARKYLKCTDISKCISK